MRARVLALAAVTAVLVGVPPAAAATDPVVIVGSPVAAKAGTISLDGRILTLGRSTRADIRAAEGRGSDGSYSLPGRNGGGVVVVYKARGGCYRQYTFPRGSTRMSDFETTCPTARTYNGVRPGMTAAKAQSTSGIAWTEAEFGSRICPVINRVMQMTSHAPYVVAWSDAGGSTGVERVDSIGAFAENAVLFQTARCGSSPF